MVKRTTSIEQTNGSFKVPIFLIFLMRDECMFKFKSFSNDEYSKLIDELNEYPLEKDKSQNCKRVKNSEYTFCTKNDNDDINDVILVKNKKNNFIDFTVKLQCQR